MPTVKRNILLNPGPATTTDTVKYAQVVPDICPREGEFGRVLESICSDLTRFAADPERYATVLFGGSGTAAVESILSSVVGEGLLLIINNGAYGKRMCEIAEAYGVDFLEFESPPDGPVDLSAVQSFMGSSQRPVTHVAVVHHETTTGLLNDVNAFGKLCGKYNADLIVDAISSYGAVPIRMDAMNIRYLAASSNKNLQGMAGVSFVIADKNRLEAIRQHKTRNFYLNLYAQYECFTKTRQMRFTPPVQTLYALKQAIGELQKEGVEERYMRYSHSWKTLMRGIARLGLRHLVPEEHHARLITSILEPDCPAYDFQTMHDYLYSRGFTIYPGKLLGLNTFRVANIGDITYKDIEAFLELLEQYLGSIGYCPESPSEM